MPYLHLRLTGDTTPETRTALAERLTELAVTQLSKQREVTAVTLEPVPADRWWIGGRPVSEAACHLEIIITQGTNTKGQKAAFVAQAFAGLAEFLGPLHAASYVVIREVPADGWGYEGRTQEERYIRGRGL